MTPIKLFDQDNVTVLLHDLHFDKEIDAVRASIEIQNRKGIGADIAITDLWDGEQFHHDFWSSLISAPRFSTQREEFLELNSTSCEDDHMLKFYNGYRSPFSFRLALFTRREGTDNLKFCSKGRKIVISKFSMDGVVVLPEETHRIGFDGETLIAAARYHIPFDIPKTDVEKAKQIQAFNDELTVMIDSLNVPAWKVLVAKYGEMGTPRFYDIENMCIYNMGASTFSRCSPTDIAFSELPATELNEIQKQLGATEDQKCFYMYTPVSREELEDMCNSRHLIAEWSHININIDLPNAPHRYWASIRQQYEHVSVHKMLDNPESDYFGMRVIAHLPRRLLPAGLMKPLLDGIVCAFHRRSGTNDVLHSITQNSFENMVGDAGNFISVLGRRDYVQPYRNGFKWNPADERLKFAWVSIVTEDCEPYFEGKIFAWD